MIDNIEMQDSTSNGKEFGKKWNKFQ
jgi:hypothetical protein